MPPRVKQPPLTHFLCLPLVTPTSRPQLKDSIARFRHDVAETHIPNFPGGLPEKAIRPVGTLHLTLGVMSLITPERIDLALRVLKGLNLTGLLANIPSTLGSSFEHQNVDGDGKGKEVDQATTLPITLRGLISMHTPSKTSVLYSSPLDPNLKLYNFSRKLRDIFSSAGLLVEDSRPLLLHATIVNTIYVPGVRGKGSGHGKSRAKLTIDARQILEGFQDFEWMKDVRLEKVAVCRMGAKANGDGEEEYVVEGEVDMP